MTEDREPRLRRLEDAIEAFLNRDASASGEDLLAQHADLADLIGPMLAADADVTPGAGAAETGGYVRRIGDLGVHPSAPWQTTAPPSPAHQS
jgi:hypothetical protein